MKNILYILSFLSTILLHFDAEAQRNRNVFWMHGYGGDDSSWEGTSNILTNDYRINSFRGSYESFQGVNTYATQFRNAQSGRRNSQNILIAHSMGGVVARDVIIKNPDYAGGLITIAAPLDGSYAANSILSGNVHNLKNAAINKLSAGPVSRYAIWNPWMFVSGFHIRLRILIFLFTCGFDYLLNDEINQSARDLAVNSEYMKSMRDRQLDKPHLAIWGEEHAPVSVNFASTLSENYMSKTELRNLRTAAEVYYNYWEIWYYSQVLNPAVLGAYNTAQGYAKGKNYLKTGLESDWKRIIGSVRTFQQQQCWEEFQCDWGDHFEGPIMNDCELVTICRPVVTHINRPSDGFIEVNSQRGTTLASKPDYTAHIVGISHFEHRWSEETRRVLRRAFNDEFDPFFRTTSR